MLLRKLIQSNHNKIISVVQLKLRHFTFKMEEVKKSSNHNYKRKRLKNTIDELNTLSKEELVERIIKLDAYNFQLKNTIEKKFTEKLEEKAGGNEKKQPKGFDFSSHFTRHILLKFCYLGWVNDSSLIIFIQIIFNSRITADLYLKMVV